MKYIDKQQEPQIFSTWKGRNNADLRSRNTQNLSSEAKRLWKKLNGTPEKEAIKISLLKEQGYICCYCQKRIENDNSSHIEHLKSQKNYPINTLDYDNFLASCDGGQIENTNRNKSIPSFPEYCGKHKSNNELVITPLQVNCNTYFHYQLDFVINPTSTTISISPIGNDATDVLSILNLNIEKLKANRYQALLSLILKNPLLDIDLDANYSNLKSKTELEAELDNLFDYTNQTFRQHNNHYLPYCQISYQVIKELIPIIYP